MGLRNVVNSPTYSKKYRLSLIFPQPLPCNFPKHIAGWARLQSFTALWLGRLELLSASDRKAACLSISKLLNKFEPIQFSGLSDNYHRKKVDFVTV